MGYEMSTDYNERTHLFKWRQLAFAAAGFLTPWFLPLCMWLEGPRAQQLKGSQGMIHGQHRDRRAHPADRTAFGAFLQGEGRRRTGTRTRSVSSTPSRLTLDNRPFWLLVVSNFITKFCMAVDRHLLRVYLHLSRRPRRPDRSWDRRYLADLLQRDQYRQLPGHGAGRRADRPHWQEAGAAADAGHERGGLCLVLVHLEQRARLRPDSSFRHAVGQCRQHVACNGPA